MKLEGQVSIHAPPETVWEIINDPNRMRSCMPGCTALDTKGADVYSATLELSVATLRGSFDAELRVSEKVPPQGYRLDLAARGVAGDVHGGGTVALSPQGLGTLLTYRGELQVTGLLMTIGQHFLAGVVEQMTAEFFAGLGQIAEAACARPGEAMTGRTPA